MSADLLAHAALSVTASLCDCERAPIARNSHFRFIDIYQ